MNWILAIVGAFGVGAMLESPAGIVIGGLLGWLLGQSWELARRVAELSARVRELQGGAPAAPPPAATPQPRADWPSASKPPPIPKPAPATTPTPQPAPVASSVTPPAPAATPPLPRTPPPPPAPRTPDWTDQALAWIRGGNPVARLGIVILFFGAAFLAKYAADHSLIPIELRFAVIAGGAIALLIIGWRLRARQPTYAHVLQGGGVAGLYLTVFAGTKLFQLLPPGFALVIMIVVAITSAILAVAQESLPLAVIGTAGGFMAPILVSTGSANHVALFTYYTLLNLGVFTVAWFRAWRVLNLVGFVFTFGIAGAFRANAALYTIDKMASTDFFVILFFLMYVAISILFALRHKPDLKGYVSASLVFGLPVAAFTLHGSLVAHIEYALAWSALILGAFYVALALILLRTRRDSLRLLAEAFAALGVIFASLAVPLAFDQHVTAAMWAVEGAGLLWLGVRQDRKLARAFGALLQLVAGVSYLGSIHAAYDAPFFLNSAYIGTVLLGVSGWLSGAWLNRAQRAPYESGWDTIFALWGTAWWLGGGLVEVHRAWPELDVGAPLAFVVATGAWLRFAGERRDWMLLKNIALLLPSLGTALGLVASAMLDHPLTHGGTWGWPLLLAAHYALLRREDRAPSLGAVAVLHAGGAWLLALLVAWESAWQAGDIPGVWRDLPWLLVPAALLWLFSWRPLKPAWPLAAHDAAYRLLASAPLALVVAGWVFVANLASDGDATPLPCLPLLNPLDIVSAIGLLAMLRHWLALDAGERARVHTTSRQVFIALGVLTFIWLNAALVRGLHYTIDTPLDADGIAHSTIVQAALSIFWGLLGFTGMVVAARRRARPLWIGGAVMMGVVVVKLFLVDTAGSGTLARIASFLVVGVLLLVTGYLSPLPPPSPERTQT